MAQLKPGMTVAWRGHDGTYVIVGFTPKGKPIIQQIKKHFVKDDEGHSSPCGCADAPFSVPTYEVTPLGGGEDGRGDNNSWDYFKSIKEYFRFFNGLDEKYLVESQNYRDCKENRRRETEISIANNDEQWLGTPMPKSFDEILSRRMYQNMARYTEFRDKHIRPLINKLTKTSYANVIKPAFTFNDREVGEFDFARASVALQPEIGYWSEKHQKFVNFDDVRVITVSVGKYRYVLKNEPETEIVVRNLKDREGRPKYTTEFRKCFRSREHKPLYHRAIRLFVYFGGNANIHGDNFIWSSFIATALTELIEYMGYCINIVGIWDDNRPGGREGWYNPETKKQETGHRFVGINIKNFESQLYIPEALHVMGDPSFYRVNIFRDILLLRELKKDAYTCSFPGVSPYEDMMRTIFKNYLPKDKEKQVLYYVINAITTQKMAMEMVQYIINEAERLNKLARQKTFGTLAETTI